MRAGQGCQASLKLLPVNRGDHSIFAEFQGETIVLFEQLYSAMTAYHCLLRMTRFGDRGFAPEQEEFLRTTKKICNIAVGSASLIVNNEYEMGVRVRPHSWKFWSLYRIWKIEYGFL